MPLAVRYVEPRKTTSVPLLDAVKSNHLQAVNVHSLTEVIRRLSSLAKHAEEIMGDIADELAGCHQRATSLEERTRRLRDEVLPSLDPEQEVLEGFEIPHPSYHFKSVRKIDQRLLAQQPPPAALTEQYEATSTPSLYTFTPLWEDGRNALHMFSNPDFFFAHWRTNMQKPMLRRRTTANLLSPTLDEKGRKRNDSVTPTRKPTKSPVHDVSGSQLPKRNQSFMRSFRRKRHGSLLSLQEVGTQRGTQRRKQIYHTVQADSFNRSSRWGSLRASMRRKKRPKLEMLTKATAAAYEGPGSMMAVPEISIKEEVENEDLEQEDLYVKPHRGSFVRRSLSFRRERRSRSRSPVAPPIPNKSVLKGMPMYTLDAERDRTQAESAKYAMLSKRHLENLELGATTFEACLSVSNAKKVSSTFLVPQSLKVRSISPLPDFTARRDLASPRISKLATNGHDKPRFVPISSRGDAEAVQGDAEVIKPVISSRGDAEAIKPVQGDAEVVKPVAQPKRPFSAYGDDRLSFTSPIDPASGQTAMTPPQHAPSPRSLAMSPSLPVGEPSAMTMTIAASPNISRPKPKRPAPPRPPHAEMRKSTASDSVLIEVAGKANPVPTRPVGIPSPLESTRRATPPMVEVHDKEGDVTQSGDIHPAPVIPVPPPPPPVVPPDAVKEAGESNFVALNQNESNQIVESKPQLQETRVIPTLARKGSLYISPQKLHRRQSQQNLNAPDWFPLSPPPQPITEEANYNKRASQILKAGGVDSGSLVTDRSTLLEAIRTGLELKKVEQEEMARQTLSATAPWDVAAILERRYALEFDSDGSEMEDGFSDQDWDD